MLTASLAAYGELGAPWWLFLVLLLVPDLSFLFYLRGPRVGAAGYNAVHTLVGPLLLAIVLAALRSPLLPVAAIWTAHIGMDRMLGYGLKYASAFADTHLGRFTGRRPGPPA